ncbi:MAG: chromate transporter [Chloroflexi bacterium]|nr:chromate transporter [Chloroflexota bacterium]
MKVGLLALARTILYLGMTTYGGPAMAWYIKATVVKKKGWLPEEQFMEGMALAQMVPGPTMVNIVSYVGYRLRGWPGLLLSMACYIAPSFILLTILTAIYLAYGEIPLVRSIFKGLAAVVAALIVHASFGLGKSVVTNITTVLIAGLSSVMLLFFRIDTVLLILTAGALGFLFLRDKDGKA